MDEVMIYLVRHGEHELVNKNIKRFIGQTDVSLSRQGVERARVLQDRLKEIDFDQIFCSDLKRAIETAEIIAGFKGQSINTVKSLREINLGDWEGLEFAEVQQRWPDEFEIRGQNIIHYRTPGGESFLELYSRVIAFFKDLMSIPVRNILIVSHAGVNRIIIAHALGMPLNNIFRIEQDYGCLNIMKCREGEQKIMLLNCIYKLR